MSLTLLRSWGGRGDGPGQFFSPIGIALDQRGRVFVTDLNNARVQIFSPDGKRLGGFDLPLDTPPRRSTQAPGIAVGGDGLIYLSFVLQSRIGVYTADGKLVRQWGRAGAGPGEFNQPGGIALGPKGTLFVADQCNHRVQVFTTDGRFLRQFGDYGSAPGQFGGSGPKGSRFSGPHFLALGRRGDLYTTEGIDGRIQRLTLDGAPRGAWGDKSDRPGGFGAFPLNGMRETLGPIGVMADRDGRVWVSSLNDRVQAFTQDGRYLFGIVDGSLEHPHGMVMDARGHLYVCDSGNQRICVYEVPRPESVPWEP